VIYIDADQSERITTVVCICAVCLVWVLFWFAAWLNEEAETAQRETEEDRADREQIRALARFDAALAAMDGPDEHESARYVG
jgi:hypothetical protein